MKRLIYLVAIVITLNAMEQPQPTSPQLLDPPPLFTCPNCPQVYYNSKSLMEHHADTHPQCFLHICPFNCGFTTNQPKSLIIHSYAYHSAVKQSNTDHQQPQIPAVRDCRITIPRRIFICRWPGCSNVYKSRQGFKIHKRSHYQLNTLPHSSIPLKPSAPAPHPIDERLLIKYLLNPSDQQRLSINYLLNR